jgi:hypothetical protein
MTHFGEQPDVILSLLYPPDHETPARGRDEGTEQDGPRCQPGALMVGLLKSGFEYGNLPLDTALPIFDWHHSSVSFQKEGDPAEARPADSQPKGTSDEHADQGLLRLRLTVLLSRGVSAARSRSRPRRHRGVDAL